MECVVGMRNKKWALVHNARRAVLRRQTLDGQHGCSYTSFWSVAPSELVLSCTAAVAVSDDSTAEPDTPLLLETLLPLLLLLLSGRTTRLCMRAQLAAWKLRAEGHQSSSSHGGFGNRPSSV
ncbi:uncharacterized protein LOC111028702 [Myzus persicae]|uniref:uncharacterized protein LOC111028702 n=1 Tax=Myzus persicae TaxID=13164 RepID=UPI000B934005|nr:uncharacterized protein LOC111028702 [Myzus persicae]